uniref:eukaryotic translation initiation factor 3 subunit C-like n=1 Tax=Myxine glutinosa TaxID=7769 RepID=UPI00358E5102
MSRFFATGSDSETESSSSGEQEPAATKGAPKQPFLLSDDEDDAKRVVRSARDKRFDELTNIIKMMRNAMKIKDMTKVLEEFENLGKAFIKAKGIIDKEGIPRFYTRILADTETFVQEIWEDREGRKKMSKNNSRSLSGLRQKLRRYNRDFEAEIKAYRENPVVSEDEREGSGEDSESDDDAEVVVRGDLKKKLREPQGKEGDEESDSDGMWSSDSSGSDTDDSDSDHCAPLAFRFLKKNTEQKPTKKSKGRRVRVKGREDPEVEGEEEADEGGWKQVRSGASMEKPKMFVKGTEINHAVVLKKLVEIMQARGKKGTDRIGQVEMLNELNHISEQHDLGPATTIKIKFNITSSLFDYNSNLAACMKPEMWKKSLTSIEDLMETLFDHEEIAVGDHIAEESENVGDPEKQYRVRGCILSFVERMDEEFTKIMQNTDAHSQEYVTQLRNEAQVCTIINRLQTLLEQRGTPDEICRCYLRRILHTYYKFDFKAHRKQQLERQRLEKREQNEVIEETDEVQDKEEMSKSERDQGESESEGESSEALVDRLCKFIYARDRTDRIRTCAILCHIYHHALHDRCYQARDLMLMSHLQDNIQHADPPVQILYNRTMVQLGLCAFRQGMIKDSHNALLDIQSSGRAKELLGQGLLLRTMAERNAEQEKLEKRRQMPFHQHVNLELLECIYLVSAMLLEIPYMAAHEFDARRRMISKQFHHQLRVSERQPLLGPPESMREHVVAASKAMKMGDWRTCRNFIINEKMNGKVWDLFPEGNHVQEMLVGKIKEESLRTYLFTYSSVYDSISLLTLADMFEVDQTVVHSVVSKMIINEELMASLDEPTHTVVMHRTEPTGLQKLALQLAEKLGSLVENNERVFDSKQGSFGYFGRDQKGPFQQKQAFAGRGYRQGFRGGD